MIECMTGYVISIPSLQFTYEELKYNTNRYKKYRLNSLQFTYEELKYEHIKC